MKIKGSKYLSWGLTVFLTACAIIIFGFLIFNFKSVKDAIGKIFMILSPVVDGFVIAFLLTPLVNFIEKFIFEGKYSKKLFLDRKTGTEVTPKRKARIRKWVRGLTIVVVYIAVIYILYCFFKYIIPEIVTSLEKIVNQFPDYEKNLIDWTNSVLKRYPDLEKQLNDFLVTHDKDINDWVTENVIGKAQDFAVGLSTGVLGIVKSIFNLILGILISIYIINSKELFIGQGKKIIYAFMKRESANAFIHNVRFTSKTFIDFFVGKIVDSIIIGILCFIVTTIVGTPYAALVSLIVGVTNVIPYFGPFIGAIPSAILVLMVDPKHCLYFIIIILVLQQLDGNVIGPAILGQSTGLSAFWVIFAITIFGGIWGPLGMLVGVPLFAVIYTSVRALIASNLAKKSLPDNTAKYVYVDYIDDEGNFIRIPKKEVKDVVSKHGFKELFAHLGKKNEDSEESDDEFEVLEETEDSSDVTTDVKSSDESKNN